MEFLSFRCLHNDALTRDETLPSFRNCAGDIVTLLLPYTSSFAILQFTNCPAPSSFEMSLFQSSAESCEQKRVVFTAPCLR